MNDNIRKKATDLLKQFEGFVARPYQDQVGVWTIGYGTTFYPTGRPVKPDDAQIDEKTALLYLSYAINTLFVQLSKLIKKELTDNEWAAILVFAYNVGVGRFTSSTLLKKINSSDPTAAEEFPRWNKVGGKPNNGLTKRRAAEMALFLAK